MRDGGRYWNLFPLWGALNRMLRQFIAAADKDPRPYYADFQRAASHAARSRYQRRSPPMGSMPRIGSSS